MDSYLKNKMAIDTPKFGDKLFLIDAELFIDDSDDLCIRYLVIPCFCATDNVNMSKDTILVFIKGQESEIATEIEIDELFQIDQVPKRSENFQAPCVVLKHR